MDNARYLEVEHRHKEKEYGIKWRAAYKLVLEKEFNALVKKHGNPIDEMQWNGNQFEVI